MSWTAIVVLARAWGPRLLGFLAGIDRRLWMALGLLLLFGVYGAHQKESGRVEVRAQVAAEMAQEVERFHRADRRSVDAADNRARNAEALAAKRARELQDVYIRAGKVPEADRVCVPGDLADRLRDLT